MKLKETPGAEKSLQVVSSFLLQIRRLSISILRIIWIQKKPVTKEYLLEDTILSPLCDMQVTLEGQHPLMLLI